ncbi:hypothetical protein KPL74_07355 [Bacillus sp. NP157]|nr:hypothetical protein KPL74_07355 [Bacillus sp. NP157]
MRASLFSLGLLALAVSTPGLATNAYSKASTSVADSWLGHDASELLVQWPVDRGFSSYEVEKTGETAYEYNFGSAAYSYDSSNTAPIGNEGSTLIMQTTTEHHEVPAEHHCTVTFYANADGIISRYEYDGVKCAPYIRGWGRPKNR